MDGWFPSGVRKQEKYIHLNYLYTSIIFTYLFKAQYRFSGAFYGHLEKPVELLLIDVVTTRLDPCIYINLIGSYNKFKGSYKNQIRNSCTFLPEVVVLSKQQALKECQIAKTPILENKKKKKKLQPFGLARQWLYRSTKETLGLSRLTQL